VGSRSYGETARPRRKGPADPLLPKPVDAAGSTDDGEDQTPEPMPLSWKQLRQQAGHEHGGRWRTFPQRNIAPRQLDKRLLDVVTLEGLLEEIEGANLSKWPAMCVATAWHRLGKLGGYGAGPRAEEASRRLAEALERLGPKELHAFDLAKIVYSFGLMRFQRGKLLFAMLDDATKRLEQLDSRGVANAMYGMGVLGARHEGFLNAVSEHAPSRLGTFAGQEIVNVVYAMARLDFRHNDFLRAVCMEVPFRFNELNAQELSNLLYAMWLLKFRHRFFLTKLCEHLPARLDELNPQNLANTVHALGNLKFKAPEFVKAVSLHLGTRVQELNKAKLLQNIIRSLTALQSHNGPSPARQASQPVLGRRILPRRPPPSRRLRAAR